MIVCAGSPMMFWYWIYSTGRPVLERELLLPAIDAVEPDRVHVPLSCYSRLNDEHPSSSSIPPPLNTEAGESPRPPCRLRKPEEGHWRYGS